MNNLIEDARRLAAVDPWYEHERAGTSFCIACGAYESHNPDCPWLALPRIVAALELIDFLGFTFEEQEDGLHVISRPKRRKIVSERAERVMEAAARLAEGNPVQDVGYASIVWRCPFCTIENGPHAEDCEWRALVAAP